MTPKQRLLCQLRGEATDRPAWSPFLAYYWEHLDEDTQAKGQLAYLAEMGADPLLRGSHALFKAERQQCSIETIEEGNQRWTHYRTPVGNLAERYEYSPAGATWFLMDHPVKTAADFATLQFIYENTVVSKDDAAFLKDYEALGEAGLYMPILGIDMKSSFQSMVEHWVGTEALVYALMDDKEAVVSCLHAMQKKSMETVALSVDSPAEAFIFWEDSSTTNISPAYFETYVAPEIDAWGTMLHEKGKLLVWHACGHVKDLLPIAGKLALDAIESLSPPPTGNVTVQEARKLLPDHIAIIGGIEPVQILHQPVEALLPQVEALLHDMQGTRYVLANSDSCPPYVEYEKFARITELVKGWKG